MYKIQIVLNFQTKPPMCITILALYDAILILIGSSYAISAQVKMKKYLRCVRKSSFRVLFKSTRSCSLGTTFSSSARHILKSDTFFVNPFGGAHMFDFLNESQINLTPHRIICVPPPTHPKLQTLYSFLGYVIFELS